MEMVKGMEDDMRRAADKVGNMIMRWGCLCATSNVQNAYPYSPLVACGQLANTYFLFI